MRFQGKPSIPLVKYLLPVAFLLIHLAVIGQTKHGLIVAIGDYPEETEWRDISSINDIPLVRSGLQKQGFDASHIAVLKNEEATKDKIVAAFKKLTKEVKAGDIVVIHFSSHGQQVQDFDGDELDGYDEAIVAYGAPAKYSADYDMSKHLIDDELEVLLQNIRLKLGPSGDLVMLVDACHSGTVSRGEISRGGMPAYKQPDYNPAKKTGDVGVFQQTAKVDESKLSPMVVISASLASQVNYEHQGAGSLSTAFSRSVDKLNTSMSYRAFFAQILKEMSSLAPSQKPAIEGAIDRTLFGGHVIQQEPYYTAYKIKYENANLYGGKLNGLFEGSKLAVFPIGTTTTAGKTPVTTGEVIMAEGTWSKVQLDAELDGDIEDYWFFVTERASGEIKLNIQIKLKGEAKDQLTALMEQDPLFNLAKEDLDFVIEDGGRGTVDVVRASNEEIFAEQISMENDFKFLLDTLKQFSRGLYMKNLELTDPRFDVSFELIPVRVDDEGLITDTLELADISQNGVPVFTGDIAALVRVTNHGDQKAYFSIIDIQPNGVINGIIPAEDPRMNHNPEDFFLEAGQSRIVDESIVYFGPPYGVEVFKLFASKEPIDFTPIITQKPATRSYQSPLERLFSDSYKSATRGGTTQKIKSSGMEASTSFVSFEIAE